MNGWLRKADLLLCCWRQSAHALLCLQSSCEKKVSRRMVIAGCQRETILLKWAGCGDGGGGGGLNYINVSFFDSLNLIA